MAKGKIYRYDDEFKAKARALQFDKDIWKFACEWAQVRE